MITYFGNFLTIVVLFVQQTKIREGHIDANVLQWFTRSGADGFDQVDELQLFVLMNYNCHVFLQVWEVGMNLSSLLFTLVLMNDVCFFF